MVEQRMIVVDVTVEQRSSSVDVKGCLPERGFVDGVMVEKGHSLFDVHKIIVDVMND